MQITITTEEVHWLRYALITTAWDEQSEESEAKKALLSVLEKLKQAEQQDLQINPPDELN